MMEVGQTFSRPYVFTREGIKRFAEEAGDENPLHRDEAEAAASRFGGIIASGAHMSGVLMSLAASQLAGMRESVGLEFQFRFLKAIPAGTATTLSWTVESIEPHEGLKGDLVTLEGRIADDTGAIYVTGRSKGIVWP
jgi:acyl dehydratase